MCVIITHLQSFLPSFFHSSSLPPSFPSFLLSANCVPRQNTCTVVEQRKDTDLTSEGQGRLRGKGTKRDFLGCGTFDVNLAIPMQIWMS